MANRAVGSTEVLMAIKLVQPGRLADIADGVQRLLPYEVEVSALKKALARQLPDFRAAGLICLYQGQRYMLTPAGESFMEDTGIRLQIDERRMFLLKETRRANNALRSGARDGLLKQ